MNNLAEECYPEILLDLRDKIAELIGDATAAFAIVEHIRAEWGGRNHYLRKERRKPAAEVPAGQEALFTAEPAAAAPELPDRLDALRARTVEILLRHQIPVELALDVVDVVHCNLVGSRFYIPGGLRFDHARRNAEIYHSFSRANMDKLCSKYGLTEQRIYQILAEEYRKRQRPLPF